MLPSENKNTTEAPGYFLTHFLLFIAVFEVPPTETVVCSYHLYVNPLALAVALKASFVARTFMGYFRESVEIIKKAIQHKGLAFYIFWVIFINPWQIIFLRCSK
ncbi:2-oxoacid ferredoxin oxidoreductase subunit beta [Thermococcus zilligii]|uniref:2-oxoacid ferredoxin oxidoreductase subunit beta n=1 Tax=Thermococcus zilligii TaxID=54076 RepID=UPI00029ACFF5